MFQKVVLILILSFSILLPVFGSIDNPQWDFRTKNENNYNSNQNNNNLAFDDLILGFGPSMVGGAAGFNASFGFGLTLGSNAIFGIQSILCANSLDKDSSDMKLLYLLDLNFKIFFEENYTGFYLDFGTGLGFGSIRYSKLNQTNFSGVGGHLGFGYAFNIVPKFSAFLLGIDFLGVLGDKENMGAISLYMTFYI